MHNPTQGFAERRQRALRDALPSADLDVLPTVEEAGAIAARAVKQVGWATGLSPPYGDLAGIRRLQRNLEHQKMDSGK